MARKRGDVGKGVVTRNRKISSRGQGSNKKTARKKTSITRNKISDQDNVSNARTSPRDWAPEEEYEEYKVKERSVVINEALTDLRNASNQRLEEINNFLSSRGMSADEPYKVAIQKVLGGETTEAEVRERIGKYIKQKLIDVKEFVHRLLDVDEWDREVAGYIHEHCAEVMLQIGVRVTELEDMCGIAEEVQKETPRAFRGIRGELLKTYVRMWYYNTHFFADPIREWVQNPTASFRTSFDEGDERFMNMMA